MLALLLIAAGPAAPPAVDPFARCLSTPRARAGEHPAIADCYGAAYAREDAVLNAEYRSAMRRLSPARRSDLRAAERRWLAERDRGCRAEIAASGDTDTQDGALAWLSCLIDRTQQRSAWLRTVR